MSRRTIRVLAGIAAAGITLTACGVGGGSDSDDTETQQRAGSCELSEEATSDEPVTGEVAGEITFQTTALKQDFSPYFETVIAEFEEMHPDVTVNWQDDPGDASFTQRLVTDAQSCQLPDVVNLNQITAYALYRENFLLDLDVKAPEIGDAFIPSVWDSLVMPGIDSHYVLPWYWGLTGIQTFNTALMERAGLDPSTPPTTIDEQFDAAAQIAETSGGEFFAFSANPMWRLPSDWQLMNVEITNEDETEFTFADDPAALHWTERMAELYQAGALPADTISSSDDPTTLYSQGRIVWGSTNASSLRFVQESNAEVYAATGVASLLSERGHAFQDGQLIAVPSTSDNPAAALAFAEYLLSPEKQSEFISDERISNFPSTEESLSIPKLTEITGDDALAQANRLSVELAQNAENAFIYAWSDAVNSAIIGEIQLAMQGDKSPQEALDAAQDKANDILSQG
ncbi:extracellular solute-binding protein [Jiangella aurantiaca]|uniref:Extracellular solute-binding protein n=1 Tax=Jiangella aurantiaca TaxID=2530373 RepID=A0A4R5AKV5_9ACTN|nr:extracellular solute-binding protein [Jiangella aurantiaca]TDD71644.1 extracellular solute-binding protein [Jiangella aurantiaca]